MARRPASSWPALHGTGGSRRLDDHRSNYRAPYLQDARHLKAATSAMPAKTDRIDARNIAWALSVGHRVESMPSAPEMRQSGWRNRGAGDGSPVVLQADAGRKLHEAATRYVHEILCRSGCVDEGDGNLCRRRDAQGGQRSKGRIGAPSRSPLGLRRQALASSASASRSRRCGPGSRLPMPSQPHPPVVSFIQIPLPHPLPGSGLFLIAYDGGA